MKVTVRFGFEKQVIPPRCRKPRAVAQVGEHTVDLLEVSAIDAPVAMITENRKDGLVFGILPDVEYRWYGERLWTSIRTFNGRVSSFTSGKPDWNYSIQSELVMHDRNCWNRSSYPCHPGLQLSNRKSELEMQEEIDAWADNCLIIDGTFYRVANEPRYVVMTFGMGNNHGGTSIHLDDWYNPNVGHNRYFSALDLDKAQDLARELAAARGDTHTLLLDPDPFIKVLIQDAVRVTPATSHGDGDPFLNQLEGITQLCGGNNALVAPLAILAATAS